MNEKQRKLVRYFVTNTGDRQRAKQIELVFDLADHRTKGKITKWLKGVVVMMLAVKQAKAAKDKIQAQQRLDNNLKTLENFK